MTAFHHHLRQYSGAFALVVAVWLLVGSLCPQGWFVCLHEDGAVAVVDDEHAAGEAHEGCPDHDDGCVDLMVSLTTELQSHVPTVLTVRPSVLVIDLLPDVRRMTVMEFRPLFSHAGEPPPHPFVEHVRLLV